MQLMDAAELPGKELLSFYYQGRHPQCCTSPAIIVTLALLENCNSQKTKWPATGRQTYPLAWLR